MPGSIRRKSDLSVGEGLAPPETKRFQSVWLNGKMYRFAIERLLWLRRQAGGDKPLPYGKWTAVRWIEPAAPVAQAAGGDKPLPYGTKCGESKPLPTGAAVAINQREGQGIYFNSERFLL